MIKVKQLKNSFLSLSSREFFFLQFFCEFVKFIHFIVYTSVLQPMHILKSAEQKGREAKDLGPDMPVFGVSLTEDINIK